MMRESFSSQITNTALDEALCGHVSSPTMVGIAKSLDAFFQKNGRNKNGAKNR
jgi:hypothetical protein